jgi:hypothetical protein
MNERILVSMTSYSGRICNVSKSIWLLLFKQTRKPDEIHLWLSTEEFPDREEGLPEDLRKILTIPCVKLHWLKKNTYVHKRHEIFKETNDTDLVFLIDDDVRYSDDLIENVLSAHEKFPDCIICYNSYSKHKYDKKKIRYTKDQLEDFPLVNVNRWCGQSMIPSKIYPKIILGKKYQEIRDRTSPISDECWFQPWTVFYDIPIFHLRYGWGIDIDKNINKWNGLCKYSHQKESNGLERRDNWLNAVLNEFPKILNKYKELFKYG